MEIWQLVTTTLQQQFKVTAELRPDTRLKADLGLDSMALLTLVVAAEDHFKICLNEDPEAPPTTLGEFVALVQQRLDER